jgi:hypothetical protein
MRWRRSILPGAWIALTLVSACVTGRARNATAVQEADGSYAAALRHASPDSAGYDPDRAAQLLTTFIDRFPTDRRRAEAADRLALLNEIRALRHELQALKAIDLGRPPR